MDREIICSFFIPILPNLVAGLTGAVVAFIELSSKFSDRIKHVFKSYGSWIYLSINAFASVFLLNLAIVFEIKISSLGISDHPVIGSIIVGLLSMGLLRSSVISINIKGNDISNIIQRMLKWSETLYDRDKTLSLLKEVPPLVKNIPFDALDTEIIPVCMAAFTYPSEEDNEKIKSIRSKLNKDSSLEKINVKTLALEIAKIVGIDILRQSVENYRTGIGESENIRLMRLKELGEKIKAGIASQGEEK